MGCVLILKTEVVKPLVLLLCSCLRWDLRSAEGLLSVFRVYCALLGPEAIWEFCLWDSWTDRADGKALTSACGLPLAVEDLLKTVVASQPFHIWPISALLFFQHAAVNIN